MNPTSPFATLTDRIDWQKVDGLVPAIVQDFQSSQVLMMGYMNPLALQNPRYSTSNLFHAQQTAFVDQRGNLRPCVATENISLDCDQDTQLVKVKPIGPTCHKGTVTCWDGDAQEESQVVWLHQLEQLLADRKMLIPVLLIRPLCMRVAPNALRRKWVKKGLKSRWRRRQGISLC